MQKSSVIPGRVVYANEGSLIVARGAQLLHSADGGERWERWVTLPVGILRRTAMRVPFLARLLRLGVHHLVFSGKRAVVIANKETFLIEDEKVQPLGRLHGSRPMALCMGENHAYYGEYRSNPERSPVSIWELDFNTRIWRPVWSFEGVRHVHGVFYDPYVKAFWVTTGDSDDESAIWRTDDNFNSIHKVVGGSQQFRAVHLLFTSDHVYFGSDAPDESNHIYRMDRSGGAIERLASVSGSVFYGCAVGETLFFSTAVEPSDVNSSPFAEVWANSGGPEWKNIIRFKKDWLPMKYFQYGQVLFPSSTIPPSDTLFCTPFGVEGHGKTIVVNLKNYLVK